MYFKKVVETKSINLASRLLYISQPALSKSIKLLEQQLQVPLLERYSRGVRPTTYGELLYKTACNIEKEYLFGLQEIQKEKLAKEFSHSSLYITIGCSTIWSEILLPEVIGNSEINSAYHINISRDISERLLDDLEQGMTYDFVLCRIVEHKTYNNVHVIPLLQSQVAIFANTQHPIFSQSPSKTHLSKLRWIKLKSLPVLSKKDLTEEGLHVFPKNFFPPAISFEVEDLMSAVRLLEEEYVILLPLEFHKILDRYGISPIPFSKEAIMPYWLGVVTSKKREVPLYVHHFINTICLYISQRIGNNVREEESGRM